MQLAGARSFGKQLLDSMVSLLRFSCRFDTRHRLQNPVHWNSSSWFSRQRCVPKRSQHHALSA